MITKMSMKKVLVKVACNNDAFKQEAYNKANATSSKLVSMLLLKSPSCQHLHFDNGFIHSSVVTSDSLIYYKFEDTFVDP